MTRRMTTNQTIAVLCIGGDWACAHGDFAGLRDVARKLGAYLPAAIQPELTAVVEACRRDIDHASELWLRARNAVMERSFAG